jgi:hypothetical protein
MVERTLPFFNVPKALRGSDSLREPPQRAELVSAAQLWVIFDCNHFTPMMPKRERLRLTQLDPHRVSPNKKWSNRLAMMCWPGREGAIIRSFGQYVTLRIPGTRALGYNDNRICSECSESANLSHTERFQVSRFETSLCLTHRLLLRSLFQNLRLIKPRKLAVR